MAVVIQRTFTRLQTKVDVPMRSYATTLLILGVVWTASFAAFQAEDKLQSGPRPGEFLPGPFHFLNVNGIHAGSPHCLVCEYGLKPVAAVFVRELPTDEEKSKALMNLLT